MLDFLWDTLYSIILIQVGWRLASLYYEYKIKELMKLMIRTGNIDPKFANKASDNSNIMFLSLEEVDNMKLLYNSITNEFICQGDTLEEVAIKFKERTQNKLGSVELKNQKYLYFIDGKISDKLHDVSN